ncbi:MAG: DUF123 domain-containing protein, partial [Candidatus Thorarchaeota archaeon]
AYQSAMTQNSTVKGVYCLIFRIHQETIVPFGSRGDVGFVPGDWVYVGSAMGTSSTRLENRISRHFSTEKKLHWHVDFLIEKVGLPVGVVWAEAEREMECMVAEKLRLDEDFEIGPRGFGSSDCSGHCGSHIFLFSGRGNLTDVLSGLLKNLGLKPNSELPFIEKRTRQTGNNC